MPFNPVLHGLRGMAAVLVLLYHWKESYPAFAGTYRQLSLFGTKWNLLLPVDFGWMGVHWFFVLSGYLLASNIWNKHLTPLETSHFWARRFTRIYPAVWLQLAVLLLIGFHLTGLPHLSWHALWRNASLWLAPLPGGVIPFNGVWWTLPIELSFYLVLPGFVWLYQRIGWAKTFLLALSITAGWRFYAVVTHEGVSFHTALPLMRALPGSLMLFMLGFFIRHLQQATAVQERGSGRWLLTFIVLLFYGWIQFLIEHRKTIAFEPTLLASSDLVVGVLIAGLIAVLLRPDMANSLIHRLLASRPMHWLGEFSYGIYLWHYPCLRLMPKFFPGHWGGMENSALALVACLAFTIPAAALSYFLIEKPALSWLAKRQRTRKNRPPTAA